MQNHSKGRQPPRQDISEKELPVPRPVYDRHILRVHNGGNWFRFFRAFYHILPKLDALFLQDLYNLAGLYQDPANDGWFLCTQKFLENAHWSVKEQERHLKVLISRGFIGQKREGLPPRRWVRINTMAVGVALDNAEQGVPRLGAYGGCPPNGGTQSTPNGVDCTPPNGVGNKGTTNTSGISSTPKQMKKGVCAYAQTDPPEEVSSVRHGIIVNQSTATTKSSHQVEDVDRERATLLRGYAASQQWFLSRSKKKWAVAFASLRKQLGNGSGQIDTVLAWYTRHKVSRPKVRNGQEFLQQWNWLCDLYDKYQKQHPTVTVSDTTRQICKRLTRQYEWPKGCAAQLESAVQVSLDYYMAFRAKLKSFPGDSPTARFARKLAGGLLPYPASYVESYFNNLNHRLHSWKDWSGNLMNLALDADKLTPEGRGLAAQWSGKPGLWDQLLKEVGA